MSHSKENTFGLVTYDTAYHLLCDQGSPVPLKFAYPRACFETTFHIADNLSDPRPSEFEGYIDGSGKRDFMLKPDAVVTLRSLEIHVKHTEKPPVTKEDQDCVDVIVYKLPKRSISVRETWCPGKFLPINL
ncbi:conserved hypothetical Ustilaginaceae-specific protein [Sporisorium reilianum SRZ2]|uniref:Conserved hypothetical Ustilaginaceae-specific protein n=1 Tax=Sporisorium reilianum (strain SRZ2) TaxID=999809 RepID=E6ZU03_SPORE|nr:conserved hypothetical Ustilaginaceae-specific protein [Sporisorium reilianum SRZ2]